MDSARTWAESHNNVALLDEALVPEGFTDMAKFLNATSIRYALTVNPTIYISYIKQFWLTAKVKIRNGKNILRPW
jgi:hypothetical protein